MGSGTGFNPTAMMAGMAMGGAMGQNFAGMMNNAMAGVNQPVQPGTVPPPILTVAYHVVINGQAAGPFEMAALQKMVAASQLTADSLVWKKGMSNWEKASAVEEIKEIFSTTVPPLPNH